MKVLVVGSNRSPEWSLAFASACKELGAALAAEGHTVLLGSDNPTTADAHVAEGILSVPGTHKIVIHRPEGGNQLPFAEDRIKHPATQVLYRTTRGDWAAGHIHALMEADVAILIGGARGVERAGYSAPCLTRPFLALPWFQGASEALWGEHRKLYEQAGISADDLASLYVWTPGQSAKVVLRSLQALYANNPFRRPNPVPQLLRLAAIGILIWVWISLFLEFWAVNTQGSVFALLFLSALLGTGLRTTLKVLGQPSAPVELRDSANEVTVSLILAFGLCLLYLVGGIVWTGNFVPLPGEASDQGAFRRVGITVSLLGLFAGFSVEEAAERLRNWLSSTFGTNTTKI